MKANIGTIKKLVCVGDGKVAAIGEKGVCRFCWEVAHSRGRVDECDDVRLNMAVRRGYNGQGMYAGLEDLALAMPRGAVIPLPSEKRAKNWLKQNRGPKRGSRWFYESAIEAGFKPRYYLGEKTNPYKQGDIGCFLWHLESVYIPRWPMMVVDYKQLVEGFDKGAQSFLKRISDWQTRVLIANFIEEPYAPDDPKWYKQYIDTVPLV